MSSAQELATRKLLLQQRSAVLRHVLALQVNQTLAPALRVVDQVQSGGRWLRGHPALVVAAAAALLVWRPRTILRMAGRGWWLWQTWLRLTQTNKS